jgi:hypothetical protein
LSFYLAVTPSRRKGGTDCRVVATKALGKAFEFSNAAVLSLAQPIIQVFASTFGQHQDEGLTELIGAIQVMVSLTEVFDLLTLLLVKLFRLADT